MSINVISSIEITTRLEALGLKAPPLINAVQAGESARKTATENHPSNAGGILAFLATVKAVRDNLVPQGWAVRCLKNLEVTVSPDGSHGLIVTGGDRNTGIEGVDPKSRNPKGSQTARFVHNNQQFDFWPDTVAEPESKELPPNTWVLMYFSDSQKEEVRVELSLPIAIDDRARISEWKERIFLGSFPSGSFTPSPDAEFDEEQAIPVVRKSTQ